MHKYKNLSINDKVKIIKSNDPLTDSIFSGIIGTIGVLTCIERVTKIAVGTTYHVYIDSIGAGVSLSRKSIAYYGRGVKFVSLHRVLPNGEIIDAMIKGLHTEDNKSIIHAYNKLAYYPMCGSRSGLDFYTARLELAPKITCQKCLSIMYHKRRALIESLQGKE